MHNIYQNQTVFTLLAHFVKTTSLGALEYSNLCHKNTMQYNINVLLNLSDFDDLHHIAADSSAC